MQSTESAGPLAATWAILHFLGDDGYLEIARQVLDATQRIAAGVNAIPGLRMLGEPDMNLVAFTTTDETSVFHIVDEMKARGWFVQPQLGFGSSKENIHLSINPASVRWMGARLANLRACTETARTIPGEETVIRAAIAGLDLANASPDALASLLAAAGVEGAALSERMAGINETMSATGAGPREAARRLPERPLPARGGGIARPSRVAGTVIGAD